MRVSLSWLSEWIELPVDRNALCERLTLSGLEIKGSEALGPDLSGFRVGVVLERAVHPQADRLSLCRVDVGGGEALAIVCGAPNVAAGQKVAVAVHGARLPDGSKIKRSKIRGVVSEGMICSRRELALAGEAEAGILVLAADAPVGAALDQVLPAGDTVLDIEITPNRGDMASLLGMAREVRALFGGTLRVPPCEASERGEPAARSVRVEILAPEACYRYAARVVRGVRVGPSPEWLVRRLAAVGLRSLNNVVDVTNFVLLEFGQPLHAFDLARLHGESVRVRQAAQGEKLLTLDGETRELIPADLVIADAEGPIALAGIMGGAESEVREGTREVLLESAHFAAAVVRRTTRRLGLRSEAAYRFERGVDRAGVERALDRAARLIAELAGGDVAPGRVIAEGQYPLSCEEIALEPLRVNRLLGTRLSGAEISALLARLEIDGTARSDGALVCRIPSFRNDLHLPVDLVEEVARIYGYDKIPATLPAGELRCAGKPRSSVLEETARAALAAVGMTEIVALAFQRRGDLDALGLPPDDPRRRLVRLQNPLLQESDALRASLVPELMRVVYYNLSRQTDRVNVFEIGRVFQDGGAELPEELLWAAAALTRGGEVELWEGGKDECPALFFVIKGIAERLVEELGFRGEWDPSVREAYLHPGSSAGLRVAGRLVGVVGEAHPSLAAHFAVDVPCALLELNLTALEALPPAATRFAPVSCHPAVQRDLAVLVDRTLPAGAVLEALRRAAGPHLVASRIFDRYTGPGISKDKVSLAFRLVFQRSDRALRDSEVAAAAERIVEVLSREFGGVLRT